MELPFQHSVIPARLLLLPKLQAVFAELLSGLAVLAGRKGTAVDGALVAVAALALQEQLLSLSAALPADGVCISCHFGYTS